MSGFPGNTASNAYERPDRRETAMNLLTARRMLPLVQRIVADILSHQKSLERLQPEQERLDRQRRDLRWPQRQRRYQLQDIAINGRGIRLDRAFATAARDLAIHERIAIGLKLEE